MPTILDEFITTLEWDVDESGLRQADSKVDSFQSKMLKVAGVVGAIFGGGAFLGAITEAADESLKMADAMGVAVDELRVMEGVASEVGVNVDTLRGHMFNLNAQLAEAQRGGGPLVEELQHFGIAVSDAEGKARPMGAVMDDIRTKIQTLGNAERIDFVDKLGFDEETIGFLDLSPEKFAALSGEVRKYGVITREQAESSRDFLQSLGHLRQALEFLTFSATDFGGTFVSDFINAIAEGIALIAKNERILKLVGLTLVGLGIATASAWGPAAVAVATTAAPFIALGAAIAAVILVVEDLWAYFEGGPSLIGDLAAEFPILKDVLDAVGKAAAFMFDLFIQGLKDWKALFDVIWGSISSAGEFITDLTGKIPDLLGKASELIPNFDFNLFGSADNTASSSIANTNTKSVDNSQRNITISKIEVNAKNGDSREIATNVGSQLRDQMRNTVQDFDSPVMR